MGVGSVFPGWPGIRRILWPDLRPGYSLSRVARKGGMAVGSGEGRMEDRV